MSKYHDLTTFRKLNIHIPGSLFANSLDPESPIREFDVYLWGYLRAHSYLRGDMSYWYSVKSLAEELKKDRKTIRDSLGRLRDSGFLEDDLLDGQMRRSRFIDPSGYNVQKKPTKKAVERESPKSNYWAEVRRRNSPNG